MLKSAKEIYKDFTNTSEWVSCYNERFKKWLYNNKEETSYNVQHDSLVIGISWLIQNSKKEVKTILDVGGLDGQRIYALIKKMSLEPKEVTIVEPSQGWKDLYKRLFDHAKLPFQIEFINTIFENASLCWKMYDRIFFIHSIYTFPDDARVGKLDNALSKDGEAYIVTNDRSSFLAQLKHLLDRELDEKRYELDDVLGALQSRNMNVVQHSFTTTFSIEERDFDVFYDNLVMWLSQGRYKGFADIEKSAIKEYVIKSAIYKDGAYAFSEQELLLIIRHLP